MSRFSLKDIVRLSTNAGETIEAGGRKVTPQSQALTLRLGTHYGVVWNRPLAITLEEHGQTRRIPIVDATRAAQAGILAAVLALALVAALTRRTPARKAC